MLNVEDLTNPYIPGEGLGVFTGLALLAAGISIAVKRFLPEKFALAAGFLPAGCVGTRIGAFGLAAGGEPASSESGLCHGVPAAISAFIALMTGFFADAPERQHRNESTAQLFSYAVFDPPPLK